MVKTSLKLASQPYGERTKSHQNAIEMNEKLGESSQFLGLFCQGTFRSAK